MKIFRDLKDNDNKCVIVTHFNNVYILSDKVIELKKLLKG